MHRPRQAALKAAAWRGRYSRRHDATAPHATAGSERRVRPPSAAAGCRSSGWPGRVGRTTGPGPRSARAWSAGLWSTRSRSARSGAACPRSAASVGSAAERAAACSRSVPAPWSRTRPGFWRLRRAGSGSRSRATSRARPATASRAVPRPAADRHPWAGAVRPGATVASASWCPAASLRPAAAGDAPTTASRARRRP